MSRKNSSGTVWSLLASRARRIWRSSRTLLERRVAEELLLAQNLGVGKLRAARRDDRVAFFDLEEAQQLRGIHDRQQVVDLEGQVVGQAIDVVAAALVEQQFQQAGHAAGPRVGQHLVAASGAGRGRGGRPAGRAPRREPRRAGSAPCRCSRPAA